jgi:hypothetical protein
MREQLSAAALKAIDDARQALEQHPVLGSPQWEYWASLQEKAVEAYDAYLGCPENVLRGASRPGST